MIERAAGSGRPGTSPARSSCIAVSVSGSSPRARKLRRPAPQSGRRWSRSGRASVMIRIGTPRLHSSRWSMKSSRPASAHWRSSNRRPTVPVDASRSKNVRQAAEQLVATAGRRVADAQQRQHRRLDPASFALVRDVRREHLRDLRPGRLRVVRLEEAGARADHLAERPERDPLAVGRRAAVVPPDAFDHAVDVLQELPGEPALADPGLARDRDEPGALLAGGGVEEVLEQAQLLVAADERRLEPVAPAATPALADDAQGQPGGHRRCLALQDLLAGGLEGDRAGRGSLGRVADEHGARARPRSGAARRC